MVRRGYISGEELELPEFAGGRLCKDVGELVEIFGTAFRNFYQLINKEGESKLNLLSFKLDFS